MHQGKYIPYRWAGFLATKVLILLIFAILPTQPALAQTVVINEVMASNQTTIGDDDGAFSDWIEIYNSGQVPVNLSGYGLSDSYATPFRWIFPAVVIAPGQFMLVWASNKNRINPEAPLHSNFAISAAGEEVILTHPNGTRLSEIPPRAMGADVSFGHQPDASGNLVFFTKATPGVSNTQVGFVGSLALPLLSLQPGFYQSTQTLVISHPDPLATIYYTLDGNIPTTLSNKYEGAITIGPQFSSNTGINMIRTNPPEADAQGFGWKAPSIFPEKATVVRAAAFRDGYFTPAPATATYFIGMEPPSLPVVSLAIDTFYLFNHHSGIYIPGIDYETYGYGDGFYGAPNANYFRRGELWEVPAFLSFFEGGNQVVGQNVGARIHGGGTPAMPQKSFRIYARGGFGNDVINHPFFPNQTHTAYRRILLRNGGQDFFGAGTHMRDGFIQKLAEPIGVPVQDYRPAILYMNGEYWGIQNLRERYDRHYFERKYGIPQGQLDLLQGENTVDEGSIIHYQNMLRYIEANPLSNPDAYAYIKTQMNVENFTDYNIINIFSANIDWPAHNLQFFRRNTAFNPNAPFGNDGRWNWVLKDMDFGFFWSGLYGYEFDMITYVTDPVGSEWPPNLPWSTFLVRSLLQNESFRNGFINRFGDLMNTIFRPERVLAFLNATKAVIAPEMEKHIGRWGYPAQSLAMWHENINRMETFASNRPAFQKTHIINYFKLAGSYKLTLNVNQINQGSIMVNRLHLAASNPLLHNFVTYPWTGEYFAGVPLPITAIPSQGYRLQKWTNSNGEEFFENPLFISPVQDITYTAIFEDINTSVPAIAETQLSIYPIPATNKLFIRLPQTVSNAQIHIINLQGRVVLQKDILYPGPEYELDISSLGKGHYFIRFIYGQQVRSARFFKN